MLIPQGELNPPTIELFERLMDASSTPSQIESLIRAGADVHASVLIVDYPRSILVFAAMHPNPELLGVILRADTANQLNPQDSLEAISFVKSADHLRFLIQSGTALPESIRCDHSFLGYEQKNSDPRIMQVLISQGVFLKGLDWNPIHFALFDGSLDRDALATIITENRSEIESRDYLGRTPLLLAAELGNICGIEALINAGASLWATDRHGASIAHYAAKCKSIEVVAFLFELGLDFTDEDSGGGNPLLYALGDQNLDTIKFLIEKLNNRIGFLDSLDAALGGIDDPLLAKQLITLGANPHACSMELRELMYPSWGYPFRLEKVSPSQFEEARLRRFGLRNPQECSLPFYVAMLVTRYKAYGARRHFNAGEEFEPPYKDPVWSAHRYGHSQTKLPDGRMLEIGGAHEDYYDPDFCIYNDVFIHESGQPPRILLYPREIFPPTDFHTATLIGEWIYIVGSVGYQEDRHENTCPVYRLHTGTFAIERLETTGEDPGRIYEHRARVLDGGRILVFDGKCCATNASSPTHQPSILDTKTLRWERYDGLSGGDLPNPAMRARRGR